MSTTTCTTQMEREVKPVDFPLEVLQIVLGYLRSYEDLAAADQVAKGWRAAIEESPELRQRLFFSAELQAGGRPVYTWQGGFHPSGSTAHQPVGHFTPPSEDHPPHDLPKPEDFIPHPVVKVHPLLEVSKHGRWVDHLGTHMTLPWTLEKMLRYPQGCLLEQQFIMQPPCEQLKLLVVDSMSTPFHHWALTQDHVPQLGLWQPLNVSSGITFGDMFEKLRDIQASSKPPLTIYSEVALELDGYIPANSHWVKEAEHNEYMYEQIADFKRMEQAGEFDPPAGARRIVHRLYDLERVEISTSIIYAMEGQEGEEVADGVGMGLEGVMLVRIEGKQNTYVAAGRDPNDPSMVVVLD